MEEIYNAGKVAALSGIELSGNPYQGNMRELKNAVEWAKGWHSANVQMPGQTPLMLEDEV